MCVGSQYVDCLQFFFFFVSHKHSLHWLAQQRQKGCTGSHYAENNAVKSSVITCSLSSLIWEELRKWSGPCCICVYWAVSGEVHCSTQLHMGNQHKLSSPQPHRGCFPLQCPVFVPVSPSSFLLSCLSAFHLCLPSFLWHFMLSIVWSPLSPLYVWPAQTR